MRGYSLVPQILDEQSSLDFWCEFTTPIHVSAAVIVFAVYSIEDVMGNEMGGVRKNVVSKGGRRGMEKGLSIQRGFGEGWIEGNGAKGKRTR